MLEWCETEVGGDVRVRIVAGSSGIRAIEFHPSKTVGERNDSNPALREAVRQLTAYFEGELRSFELPLEILGTDFQQRVWRELLNIRYGEIRTYAQIASAVGTPKAVRAVGAAN